MNFFDRIKKIPGPLSRRNNSIRIAYGPDSLQFGELNLPQNSTNTKPYPVVILIHGGFWRSAYNLSLMRKLARNLAKRGIAAWNIEYRRVGDIGGGWPGTMQDVALATDYLRTMAPLYELDIQRVVPIGHSAGGHLAFWLAARHRITKGDLQPQSPLALAGAVSLAGAVDLEQVAQLHLGNNAVIELLGCTPDQVPERYATASPAALLPLGVPQVLVHGTSDDRVPFEVSQSYAHKATQAGDQATLLELPGADHFVVIDPSSKAWALTIEEVQELLDRKGC